MNTPTFTTTDGLLGTLCTLGVLLLFCAYSAQYWAKKSHDELKEIRELLRRDGK